MRKCLSLVVVMALGFAVATVAAFGRPAAQRRNDAARVRVISDLWFELIGQFQNSALGVTPVTHIHYGYLSYVRGVVASNGAPDPTTARFTFFADGASSPVIINGPFRVLTRTGTLTIYRDTATNSDFANPGTFRDGTPVLVAHYRQISITNTLTNAVRTYHRDRITANKSFDSGASRVRLGVVGETFREEYSGQVNMPGPPSGYFVGYAVSR